MLTSRTPSSTAPAGSVSRIERSSEGVACTVVTRWAASHSTMPVTPSTRGSCTCALPPPSTEKNSTSRPAPKLSGRIRALRSAGPSPIAAAEPWACASQQPWVCTTPLGRPVDPDV
ncbi:hypothetical protein BJF78_28690 [Pseudonocardia sp. CNS-139]|nr:hypothetical protein BJF78_28690 [Pseudonocardia sp. CNS-139]